MLEGLFVQKWKGEEVNPDIVMSLYHIHVSASRDSFARD